MFLGGFFSGGVSGRPYQEASLGRLPLLEGEAPSMSLSRIGQLLNKLEIVMYKIYSLFMYISIMKKMFTFQVYLISLNK